MRKIIINDDWGGFGLSFEAMQLYDKLSGLKPITDDHGNDYMDLKRDDPVLVRVVEQLGNKANGMYASLKIVEIPEDVEWIIVEYDGVEHVAEKHRTWS